MPLRGGASARSGSARGILVVEMLSIIVAVALGFLVTEWREGISNSRRSNAALAAIAAEIALNREHLAERVPYYERMVATLDSLVADHGASSFAAGGIEGWRGLNPPFLRGAAYEAASATGALSHMEFTTADRVAQAYLAQEMIDNTFDWTLQSVLAGHIETWVDAQRAFGFMLEVSRIGVRTYDSVLEGLPRRAVADARG